MVDNLHSKHSNTNVSPNREAMLGQNIINSSKPSARSKQLTEQIINTKETTFLYQKWNNEHVHLMQGRWHSSIQQWSINTYLGSEELTSTVWFLNRQMLRSSLTLGLAVWAIWNTGCYTWPAAIQDENCRKSRVHTLKVGFLGAPRSMEPVGLWQRRQNWQCSRGGKRHDQNVVTKYH